MRLPVADINTIREVYIQMGPYKSGLFLTKFPNLLLKGIKELMKRRIKSLDVIWKCFLNIVKQQKNLSINVLFNFSEEVWILLLLSFIFILLLSVTITSLSIMLLKVLAVPLFWVSLGLFFLFWLLGSGFISIF